MWVDGKEHHSLVLQPKIPTSVFCIACILLLCLIPDRHTDGDRFLFVGLPFESVVNMLDIIHRAYRSSSRQEEKSTSQM